MVANRRAEARKSIIVADRHVMVKALERLMPVVIDEHITTRVNPDGIAAKTANRIRDVLHVMFSCAIWQQASAG